MILAMMIAYIAMVHLVFNVFKWFKPSTRNQIYVTVIGCFLIYCMLLVINFYQPMSTDLRVVRFVVPIQPRVAGRVTEVPVTPNVPLNKGDVLFRIDARPYEATVAQLKARLAEAEQQAKMLPVDLAATKATVAKAKVAVVEAKQQVKSLVAALAGAKATSEKLASQLALAQSKYDRGRQLLPSGAITEEELDTLSRNLRSSKAGLAEARANLQQAQVAVDSKIGGVSTVVLDAEAALLQAQEKEKKAQLALESTINGENTTVARLRAELSAAEIDLEDTVVYAPADGFVTDLTLRPGQVIKPANPPVITFINQDEYALAASFRQEVLHKVAPGDEAEIALDGRPGVTLTAKVKNINMGIPQGQVIPSGQLVDPTPVTHGRFFVQFELEDDQALALPAGEAGAATIYTNHGRAWIPVRKVFFRWYTWLNYILTDMDIRGERQ